MYKRSQARSSKILNIFITISIQQFGKLDVKTFYIESHWFLNIFLFQLYAFFLDYSKKGMAECGQYLLNAEMRMAVP